MSFLRNIFARAKTPLILSSNDSSKIKFPFFGVWFLRAAAGGLCLFAGQNGSLLGNLAFGKQAAESLCIKKKQKTACVSRAAAIF